MLAFALLFGGVCGIVKWGSRTMGQRSRASLVGGFDRGLGAGCGAVKELALAPVLFLGDPLLSDNRYGHLARPTSLTESRPLPAQTPTRSPLREEHAERQAESA